MTITTEVAGVHLVDVVRIVTVVLTVAVMAGIAEPITAARPPGSGRVWLLLIVIWTYMARGAMSAVANLGNPHMPWYATPVTFMGSLLGCAYLAVYHRDVRRGQRLADKVNEFRREARDEPDPGGMRTTGYK